VGKAFACAKLNPELRERIVLSPISLLEVFSQLTIPKPAEVFSQIHAVLNWTNPDNTGLMVWPSEALFGIWTGERAKDDGFTKRMQSAYNACLAADSAEALQEDAGKLKDVLDKIKDQAAANFARLLESARDEPLNDERLSDAWLRGIASRIDVDPKSGKLKEIASRLSAYYEYEYAKLHLALSHKDYNALKHRNDVIDAEQLIYLSDESLCFLTCDTGFRELAKKSPQAARIVTVQPGDLREGNSVEALLRKLLNLQGG
jgi:hypothetical protein